MAMATQTQTDLPFRGLPAELRIKIWEYCITDADTAAEIIEYEHFNAQISAPNRPRGYLPLQYSFREHGLLIIGANLKHILPLFEADFAVFEEALGKVGQKACLTFRGLHYWDLFHLRKLPEVRRCVRRLELRFGSEDFLGGHEVGQAEHLRDVLRYLDGFQKGMRLFVNLDETAVGLLVRRDVPLKPFAALLESPELKRRVGRDCAVCEREWTVELVKDSGESWAGVLAAKE